jgi:hypothetical protein
MFTDLSGLSTAQVAVGPFHPVFNEGPVFHK